MTTIHLVRHGETEWNLQERLQGHRDSPLTGRGIAQAHHLAERLRDYRFDAVLCSSSGRAGQTAEIIVSGRDLPPEPQDRLRELNLGVWEGCSKRQIQTRDPDNLWNFWNRPDRYQPPANAESFEAFGRRVRHAFNDIARQYRGRQVLVVTHMVFIKTLLSQLDQRPLSQLWAPPQLENCAHRILQPLPSGGWQVTATDNEPNTLIRQTC
ncbi:histidine phosphatase family protein [Motiliproteus sp. SC1-56]|uniref:histidine phosphatase family protein n=1 Tax=Motiliproteus sp. SC1-56 TaxID=2799565 RepID=UPI001A8E07ED|nr:histidine phosphatase family protein [Motiliproteus sp. SC1-56]